MSKFIKFENGCLIARDAIRAVRVADGVRGWTALTGVGEIMPRVIVDFAVAGEAKIMILHYLHADEARKMAKDIEAELNAPEVEAKPKKPTRLSDLYCAEIAGAPKFELDIPQGLVMKSRFGELTLHGCERHLDRLDLSCCKIRQPDGTALTTKQVWQVISDAHELTSSHAEPLSSLPQSDSSSPP